MQFQILPVSWGGRTNASVWKYCKGNAVAAPVLLILVSDERILINVLVLGVRLGAIDGPEVGLWKPATDLATTLSMTRLIPRGK
jgi:hypothetical protein